MDEKKVEERTMSNMGEVSAAPSPMEALEEVSIVAEWVRPSGWMRPPGRICSGMSMRLVERKITPSHRGSVPSVYLILESEGEDAMGGRRWSSVDAREAGEYLAEELARRVRFYGPTRR